jgi:hypothetical protein
MTRRDDGIIEQPGTGQGRLKQLQLVPGDGDALPDVIGEPADPAEWVPVLLTSRRCAHPPSLEPARAPGQPDQVQHEWPVLAGDGRAIVQRVALVRSCRAKSRAGYLRM